MKTIYANVSSGFIDPKWKIKNPSGSLGSTHTLKTHAHIFVQVRSGMVLNEYVATGLYCYILAHPPC